MKTNNGTPSNIIFLKIIFVVLSKVQKIQAF